MQTLSKVRNAARHTLRKRGLLQRDYVIIADADGLIFRPADSVRAVLRNASEWDVVTFNRVQNEGYYDTWALRMPGVYNKFSGLTDEWIKETLKARLDAIGPGEYLPVYSAGNGFIMYKSRFMHGCTYGWRAYEQNSRVNFDCEHAVFNHCVRNAGARIVIAKRVIG